MHRPHLRASFVIYIHNVQFQLSWEMILPQKLTSIIFYLFPHGCGITLYTNMKWVLGPLLYSLVIGKLASSPMEGTLLPFQPISYCILRTFWTVPYVGWERQLLPTVLGSVETLTDYSVCTFLNTQLLEHETQGQIRPRL